MGCFINLSYVLVSLKEFENARYLVEGVAVLSFSWSSEVRG